MWVGEVLWFVGFYGGLEGGNVIMGVMGEMCRIVGIEEGSC